jgi:hypothetical protein
LPSGDHAGWRASLNRSVIRFAAPPRAGSVQMLPWRSTASVRPSGDTATDIDVPSCTSKRTCCPAGGICAAALPAVASNTDVQNTLLIAAPVAFVRCLSGSSA